MDEAIITSDLKIFIIIQLNETLLKISFITLKFYNTTIFIVTKYKKKKKFFFKNFFLKKKK